MRHKLTEHKNKKKKIEQKNGHNIQYRDCNFKKSQLIIGFADEEEIWNNTPYSINYLCYGLYIQYDKPHYLGFPAYS